MTARARRNPRRHTPKTPEGLVLQAVTDLLTAERIWWVRMNTGTHILDGANGKRRVFKAGRVGMADLLALPEVKRCGMCEGAFVRKNGTRWSECCTALAHIGVRPLWIECKRPVGGVQSPAQIEFQAEVEAEGHAYVLASDATQVAEWLRGARDGKYGR